MILSPRYLILSYLLVVVAPAALAQTPPPSREEAAARARWQRLQDYRHVNVNASPGSIEAVTPASYLERADELRDFPQKHPGDSHVREARHLEALNLLYAEFFGDNTLRDRIGPLVEDLRRDQLLPELERFRIAAFDANNQVPRSERAQSARLNQQEKAVRKLIDEFPAVPEAYQALWWLARSSGGKQAGNIARDLLAMPCSAEIKAGARILLSRQQLVGQRLRDVVPDDALPTGVGQRKLVLYTWNVSTEWSLLLPAHLAEQAPAGADLIGVSLDKDVRKARAIAEERKLPGRLIFDDAGPDSDLARALKLDEAPLVLITDRNGVIETVTGWADAELTQARKD